MVGVLSTFTGGNTVQLLDPTQVLYAKDSENVFGRGGVQSSTGGTVPVSWQMTADWPWSATGVSLKKNTSTSSPSTTPTSTPTTPPSPHPATSTPVPGGTPPAIPSLSAPANNVTLSDFTPTFTWTKPARATSYRLQVSENSSFSNTTINTTVTTLTYTPTTDLAGGKTYYWRVQGINSAGTAGSWSTVRSFHLISGAVPTLQVPSNNSTVSELRPSFDWSDVPGATGYQIQISGGEIK